MSLLKEIYQASAPGSLMLMGEHAVLHGKKALVAAVDKKIHVCLTPRSDALVELRSDRYETVELNLAELRVLAPFQFVSACLYRYRKQFKNGFTLDIKSEFSDQVGLGSSAAVTVATLRVLAAWLGLNFTPLELLKEAREIIRSVQGLGSGADVAASVLGGVVAYRATPLSAERIADKIPLTVIYSGYKTPTVEVVRLVQQHFSKLPLLFKAICQAIHLCVEEGVQALQAQDWARLGKVMNQQQGLMQSLGVSTPELESLLAYLRLQPGIYGAKISGSGLGDCVLGLGEADDLQLWDGVCLIEVCL